jgi:hypothetical protein
MPDTSRYKAYSLSNFRDIPQMKGVPDTIKADIEVVGQVLPFKTNNFVVDHLIDWAHVPEDPLFVLTFPQRDMLLPNHYAEIAGLVQSGAAPAAVKDAANRIRLQLNPPPRRADQPQRPYPRRRAPGRGAAQVPRNGAVLSQPGADLPRLLQLLFPLAPVRRHVRAEIRQPEVDRLVDYLQANPQVSDVLFTGGDPLIMSARHLAEYVEPLLDAGLPNLRHIRIVTKALSYWPNKFLTDDDTPDLLALFRKVGEYDDQATWLNELKPAFGEAKFFYQDELEAFYRESIDASHAEDYE